MKISRLNLIKLGIFVLAALLLFIAAIYYLGRQQNIFRSGMSVYTEFKDVKGLQTGNSVRYLGTSAGYVAGIRIISDTIVRTEIVIDHGMSQFIRENSRVEIQNDGVMGSKVVVIHPGTPEYETIRPGSKLPSLPSMSIEEIFRALEGTVDYTTRAAQNLWKVSESVAQGDGMLGKMLYDETMKETFDLLVEDLTSITRETRGVLQNLNTADSDIGRLLNEDHLSQRLQQSFNSLDTLLGILSESSDQLRQATRAVNHSEGLINKLLYDGSFSGEVDTTLTRINHALEDVMETSGAIRQSWIFNLFTGRRDRQAAGE